MHATNQLSIIQFITTRSDSSTSFPSSDLHWDSEDRSENRGEDRSENQGDGFKDGCDPTGTVLLSDDSTASNGVDTADDPGPSVLTEDAGQFSTISNTSRNTSTHDDVNTSNSLLPLKFHPPSTYKFPKRKFGASGER